MVLNVMESQVWEKRWGEGEPGVGMRSQVGGQGQIWEWGDKCRIGSQIVGVKKPAWSMV